MTGRARNGICDRGSGRALRCLSSAQKRLAGPRHDVDLDSVRDCIEAQDRIARPVDALDRGLIKIDALVECPAERLHDATLDLVANAVRIDDLAGIDGRYRPYDARTAGHPRDFDLHRYRAIGRQVLVACKRKAPSAS